MTTAHSSPSPASAGDAPAPASKTPRSHLMLWVTLVFVVQAAVWAGWLTFAAQHRVAEVPLAKVERVIPNPPPSLHPPPGNAQPAR